MLVFAWMSDWHLDGGANTAVVRSACRAVREEIRPHFVVLTGDNSAHDPAVRGERARLPQSLRRHLALRDVLAAELPFPAVVMAGDNWARDAEKVFGSSRFSLNVAGLHLVVLEPDRRARGTEGCAVFDPATWDWLERDLDAHRQQPTLVFLHENLVPPTFLEAPRLEQMLLQRPQVLATLSGHLHLDFEFHRQGLAHFVCPAMVPGTQAGFKVATLYGDRLVLNTWELDAAAQRFRPTLKWQRLEIPEGALRAALQPVVVEGLLRTGRHEMPAAALIEDPGLLQRQGELVRPMLQFLGEYSSGALNPPSP